MSISIHHRFLTKFCPLFLLLTLAINSTCQEKTMDYSDAIKIIEVWLEAEKDYSQYPGLSAAIANDSMIIWKGSFGYANKESKSKSKTNTVYSICSISKLFTAIAVLQLRDQGKLSLESKIHEVLPWFDLPQVFDDSEPITVRSLLTHSSGLPRESEHPYWTYPDFPFPTKEEIIARLKEQKTLYPASTYFQYSNLGLTLLGMIVEEVTGESFNDYVTTNIIVPLGLTDTRPKLPEDLYGNQLAIGYSALKRDRSREQLKLFQGNGITPAAGFSSTVEDLISFGQWQLNLLQDGGEKVLKASTLKEMQRVHFMDPNWRTSWGLGFVVSKYGSTTMVGHGGSCPGYRSQLSILPKKKITATAMFNSGGVNTHKYVTGMIDLIMKVKETTPDTTGLADYTGFYNSQPWGSEEIVAKFNNQLVFLSLPNSDPAENMTRLKHIEGDTFRRIRSDDELGETVQFFRDINGNVTHYTQHQNNYRKLKSL